MIDSATRRNQIRLTVAVAYIRYILSGERVPILRDSLPPKLQLRSNTMGSYVHMTKTIVTALLFLVPFNAISASSPDNIWDDLTPAQITQSTNAPINVNVKKDVSFQ